jgi:hypothetical protein
LAGAILFLPRACAMHKLLPVAENRI